MNDLVRPTALFSGAPVPAISPSGVRGTVPNPPPQVSQLSAGSTLAGVVVGHDAEGHTLVRTDLGTLSVTTKAQLPVNSEVILHIRSSGGQLHVLIVHSELPQGGAKVAPPPPPLQPTGTQPPGTKPPGTQPPGTQPPGTQPPGTQVAGAHLAGAQPAGTGPAGAGPAGTGPAGAGPQSQAATAAAAGQAVPGGHGPAADLLILGQQVRAVVQSAAAAPNPAAAGSMVAGEGAGGGAAGGAGGATGSAGQPPATPALSAIAVQLAPGSELQLRIISVQAPAAQTAGPQTAGPQTAGPQTAGPQAVGNPAPGGPANSATAPGPQNPTTSGATAPATTAPATTAPGAPGSVPGIAGRIAAYGALQGGAGQAGSPTITGATPNGPNATATTPQTAASAVAAGPGATPGPGAPAVTAIGTMASYAAGGAAASPAALLAAHGIGPGSSQGSGAGAATQAAQPGGAPGINVTGNPGGNPGGSSPAAAPATPTVPGAAPGATSGATPGAAPGATQFTGTVTTVTHAGQPVLQTPLGTLTLEIRAPLQAGSRISFELPAGAQAPSGPGGAGPGPAPLGTLAHSWPALDEALRVLQEVAPPGVAAATLHDAIPQPGSRLASGLLFFLSALSAGNMTRWIGNPATQALKNAGRDSLLSRLGQDFGQLGRLADNEGGDWRLFFIPFHDGDQLQQLRLFLRHGWQDRDGGSGQDDEDQTRFVVEVEMSHLGDLQLDGLVRDKRLDLILRSRAPLPEFMRRDITQIFHEANEITGNQGKIGFQSSLEWKAMPIEAPEVADDASVVV